MELFDGKIIEPEYSDNTEYILVNNEDFYDIGFRVMKNQEDDGLIQCHRLKYNGKVKLVYFTEFYTPLKTYLKRARETELGFILNKLWAALEEIQENGFINISTIDLRLDKIFIDEKSSNIKLAYLPIISDTHVQLAEIKAGLEGRISSELGGAIPAIAVKSPVKAKTVEKSQVSCSNGIILRAILANYRFIVNQDEFIIGKSADRADGVIESNPAISRQHCKLVRKSQGYTICDLGSSNGTFVNGARVVGELSRPLKSGDVIKLANMEFVVE